MIVSWTKKTRDLQLFQRQDDRHPFQASVAICGDAKLHHRGWDVEYESVNDDHDKHSAEDASILKNEVEA